MGVGPIALAAKFPAYGPRVGHEARGLLSQDQVGPRRAPSFQTEHALVCFNHVDTKLPHHLLDARERPRLGVGRVLVDEYSSTFNLLSIKLSHKLHVSDTLGLLVGLARAIRDERLELAERNTRWTADEN